MGYRAVFVTDDHADVKLPSWFLEKWQHAIYSHDGGLPLSARYEGKAYFGFADLVPDLQRALFAASDGAPAPLAPNRTLHLVWLHEDGEVVRVTIRAESITSETPDDWNAEPWEGPDHNLPWSRR